MSSSSILDAYGRTMAPYFEGASRSPRMSSYRDDFSGPNVPIEAELRVLSSRSRQLGRNNAWAIGALESYVDNVIGSGIDPEPKFPKMLRTILTGMDMDAEAQAELASEIREHWDMWSCEADADGMANIYGIQAQVARTVCESGECFIRRRNRRASDGYYLPLQVQILEPDYCPIDLNGSSARTGNYIKAGIEFNRFGRRVGYHMYRSHPGEIRRSTIDPAALDTVFVPASEIIHVAELGRPGQIRFQPKTSPVLLPLMTIERSNDANLTLQYIAALFGGFIEEDEQDIDFAGDTQDQSAIGEGEPDDTGTADIEMQPGIISRLGPGKKITFPNLPDLGNNYLPFQSMHLREISRVYGLPYHDISGDMTSASFASLRADQNKMKRHILRKVEQYKHQGCRGVYIWFMEALAMYGLMDLPEYETNPKWWHVAQWNHQGWESTNPLQDANAHAVDLAWGLTSRRRIVAQRGANVRDVDKENAEDQERATELGVSYKSMEGQNTTRGTQIGPFSDDTMNDDVEEDDDSPEAEQMRQDIRIAKRLIRMAR